MTKPESPSRFASLRELLTPSRAGSFLPGQKGFARAVRMGVAAAALTAAACSSQARVENRYGGDQPDAGITQPNVPDAGTTPLPQEDGGSDAEGADGGDGGEPPPPPLDTDGDGIPNSEEYRGCETLVDDGSGTHADDDGDGWCNGRDNSPAYNPSQADGDLDGVGDATDNDLDHANALQVDGDDDGHGTPGDCDDNDDTVPGAEVCDGEDNDCDGVVDPDCECEPTGSTRSVGVAVTPCVAATETCTASGSGSIWETTSPATGPTLEVCDGADNDCDGAVDESLASCDCVPGVSAPRACGSDVGECDAGTQECRADGTWGDCVGQQGPTTESCNGSDDDCDGEADEDYDVLAACTGTGACGIGPDGVGVRECKPDHSGTQCSVNRGGSHDRALNEELANERDDDCDGLVDEDRFSVVGGAAGETARMGEACHRGAESGACRTNGVYVTAGDRAVRCNAEYPGAPLNPADDEDAQDLCNGVDDDCDGIPDDGCPGPEGETRSCGTDVGACASGTETRGPDGLFGTCVGAIGPVTEACDFIDNDCDGFIDEFGIGTRGAACQTGVGACAGSGGAFECLPDGSGVRCDTDVGGSRSRATVEICDVNAGGAPVDNDCDGLANEGSWEREDGATTTLFGLDCNPPGDVCGPGHTVCVTSSTVACSSWLSRPVTGDSEVGNCDGRDNNCDGSTDEGCGGCDEGDTSVCGDPDGECRQGTQTCDENGELGAACVGSTVSTPERCDGLDNDCNGAVDNGFPVGGVGVACDGVGECGAGTLICNAAHDGVVCPTDVGQVDDDSVAEVCDGLDQDCDRVADDGLRDRAGRDLGLPGVVCPLPGDCRLETVRCEYSGALYTECTTSGRGGVVTERCDGRDNDCDGSTDETFVDKDAPCSVTCPDASTISGIRVCAVSEVATVCSATLLADCP